MLLLPILDRLLELLEFVVFFVGVQELLLVSKFIVNVYIHE